MTTETLYGNYELLLDKLTRYFTQSELSDLCARLGVYEGDLQVGPTQRDWAASLLRLLDATGRQMGLYLQLCELRPTGQWPHAFALPLSQAAHVYANLPHAGRLPELTALTVPTGPHLLTRIGRESEYRAIVALLQRTAGGRSGAERGGSWRALAARLRRPANDPAPPQPGQTVFLMGRPGSGRRALLADAQKTALSLGYHVATLRFDDQEEAEPRHVRVRWERIVGKQAAAYVAKTFPRTARDAGPEWAELMRQLADGGAFADVPQGSAADDPRALNALVRAAARRGPLLVCVENLDAAQSLWIDLLDDLAVHEIARELPVVLLISLDAPPRWPNCAAPATPNRPAWRKSSSARARPTATSSAPSPRPTSAPGPGRPSRGWRCSLST